MAWEYAERYNSEKEWNPRLIACLNCQTYLEPDQYPPDDDEWCIECNQYMSGEID